MPPVAHLCVAIFFLMGTFLLTALSSAFRRNSKRGSKKQFKAIENRFLYRKIHLAFFPKHEYEGIFFATTCALNVTRFFFAVFAVTFVYEVNIFIPSIGVGSELQQSYDLSALWIPLSVLGFLLISFFFGDFLPRLLGTKFPDKTISLCAPAASIYLLIAFPLTYSFLRFTRSISESISLDYSQEKETLVKQQIIEIIQEAHLTEELDENEKKLLTSLLAFCEHLTKEVMIPRVDVFSLEASTSIRKAAKLLEEEGFSRVPVYRESVDNMVGILMYKDVLSKYMEYADKGHDAKILEAPISTIQKTPLYTPGTKKISDLLQDFRNKQVHIAIVVDEYGGTEGIITIEDILEDIVGQISDEYDVEEEMYTALPDGSWIVDPRMSILDAEEEFGIDFKEEGDYDTVGGYIFHLTGEIPSRGFKIHSDEFEIEVLKSSERAIEKVKIAIAKNLGGDHITQH